MARKTTSPLEARPAGLAPASQASLERRIAELQRTTQELAAKLAAHQTPPPPPPVVIVRHVAAAPTTPSAFWERSYLGRAGLRGRR